MTDHTQHLKDTYWEIKYREWRTVILVLPVVTFFIGGFLSWLYLPHVQIQQIPIEIVKQIPVEKVITVAKEPTQTAPSTNTNRVMTLYNEPCGREYNAVTVPTNSALYLPKGCGAFVSVTKGTAAVLDTASPKGVYVFLQPPLAALFHVVGDLLVYGPVGEVTVNIKTAAQ